MTNFENLISLKRALFFTRWEWRPEMFFPEETFRKHNDVERMIKMIIEDLDDLIEGRRIGSGRGG